MSEHCTGRLLLHLSFARSFLSRLQTSYPPAQPRFHKYIIYPKGFFTCLIWEGCIVSPMIALLYSSKSIWTDFAEVEGFLDFENFPPAVGRPAGESVTNEFLVGALQLLSLCH